jgi:hypothetical protein
MATHATPRLPGACSGPAASQRMVAAPRAPMGLGPRRCAPAAAATALQQQQAARRAVPLRRGPQDPALPRSQQQPQRPQRPQRPQQPAARAAAAALAAGAALAAAAGPAAAAAQPLAAVAGLGDLDAATAHSLETVLRPLFAIGTILYIIRIPMTW